MKAGVLVSIAVASLALMGMTLAFLNNASPYVTVSEAGKIQGENLHIVGDVLPNTLSLDMAKSVLRFKLRDEEGTTVPVEYVGPPPSNMGSVSKVVAVGGMKGDHFEARKLIIKCPSKYEGEKGAQS